MRNYIRVFWIYALLFFAISHLYFEFLKENYPIIFAIIIPLTTFITLFFIIYHFVLWYKCTFINKLWKTIWFLILLTFPILGIGPFVFYIIVIEFRKTLKN